MVNEAVSDAATDALRLLSPAKLNLFLHITGRRADGYHTLQTVFQLLNYGDDLSFTSDNTGALRLTPTLPGVADDDNLILRAARLIQTAHSKRHSKTPGAVIHLEKRLPMGGGIGGGSSNAATTLIALNHLWQTGLTLEALVKLGTTLGADVPVFIRGQSAWAEGVGDEITPLDLPPRWYLVLVPKCHVSTAEIFSHKDLTRDRAAIKVAAFLQGGGENDCQKLVRTIYPEVDNALIWLNKFSATARMTGTGACVFASVNSETEAREILSRIPADFSGFVAEGINQSPYYDLIPKPV